MTMLLRLVPTWLWFTLLAVVLLGGGHWLDVQRKSARAFKAGQAEVQARWDAERVAQLEAARQAEAAARTEEARRAEQQREATRAYEARIAQLTADLAAARGAADRLQRRIAALIAAAGGAAGPDPADPGQCQAAGTAARLLAELHRRLDEAAGGIAEFADRAHAAGTSCQLEREALTTP